MVKFTVSLSDILGSAYYRYELSSSNYNPNINNDIAITCTCKNVLGNPVSNKTLELFQNGSSVGTATTNANGIATWTVSCDELGLQDFRVTNTNIQIKVTGWKQVATTTVSGVTYTCYVNGEGVGRVHIRCSNVSFAVGNSHEALNWIPSPYKPIGECEVLTERKTTDTLIIYLWSYQTLIGITNTGSSAKTKTLSSTIMYSY